MPLIHLFARACCVLSLCVLTTSCRTSKDPAPTSPSAPRPEASAAQPKPDAPEPEHAKLASPEPSALELLVTKLQRLESGEAGAQDVRVLHIGDSHVASDLIGQELRRLMQERFGDGGRGYVFAGRPWRHYRQAGVEYSMEGDWERNNARGDTPGPFGAGGVRLTSATEGDAVLREVPEEDPEPFESIAVSVLTQPEGGQLRIVVDDVLQGVVPTAGDAVEVQVHRLDAAGRVLRLEVVGDGPVTLLGTHTAKKRPGFIVPSIGINGARYESFLRVDATRAVADLAHLDPDLVVITLGTNEAFNLRKNAIEEIEPHTAEDIRGFAHDFIGRIQSASPDAACVVMLPMDFAYRPSKRACRAGRKKDPEFVCDWHTTPSLGLVTEAVRQAAETRGCSTWDARAVMGGEGAVLRWAEREPALAAKDGVHLTKLGYTWVAERLYMDIAALLDVAKPDASMRVGTTFAPVPEDYGVED